MGYFFGFWSKEIENIGRGTFLFCYARTYEKYENKNKEKCVFVNHNETGKYHFSIYVKTIHRILMLFTAFKNDNFQALKDKI